ncbi:MAG: prepilin-type N-terminal cleavage/methylation domain-containing protein [Parcubacteria group bacterium]|nr:prepilin-type N-terminal cleavage/methylation domain-containing protein [Parcubacteria group bacterium]
MLSLKRVNFKSLRESPRGFTLLELLIVVAIIALTFGVVFIFIVRGVTSQRHAIDSLIAQDKAQKVVTRLTKRLRAARPSDIGSYPIAEAEAARLTFYSNVDGDQLTERVTYEITNETLTETVLKPSGDPLEYTGTGTTELVIEHVRNEEGAVFTYYARGANPGDPPLAEPVAVSTIGLVEISLIIDEVTNMLPPPFQLRTLVWPRNI